MNMKKIILIIIIICFSFNFFTVHGMALSLYEGISIKITGEDIIYDIEQESFHFDGDIDILIRKGLKDLNYFDEPSDSYKELHPLYETYTFLESDEWVSYHAFIERSSKDIVEVYDVDGIIFNFGVSRGQSRYIQAFKVVYHIDGEIVWTSDEIQSPERSFYERYDNNSHIVFDQHNPVPTSFYEVEYNPMITLNIAFLSVVLIASIAARFIILKLFSVKKEETPYILILSTIFLMIMFYTWVRMGFNGFSWLPIRLNPFFNQTWPYFIFVSLLIEKIMYFMIYRHKSLIKPLMGLMTLHAITCSFLILTVRFFS